MTADVACLKQHASAVKQYAVICAHSLNLSDDPEILYKALRHNKRQFPAERGPLRHIDLGRTHLNETLVGPRSATEAARLALQIIKAAGVPALRKNASICVEFVFSLPKSFRRDDRAYFLDCIDWLEHYYGRPNCIISADVHRDQAAPHCHVLILPILDGKLSGRKMLGNRKQLAEMQADFHAAVAFKHGQSKAPPQLRGREKVEAVTAVIAHLRKTADPMLLSPAWPTVQATIVANPRPYMDRFRLDRCCTSDLDVEVVPAIDGDVCADAGADQPEVISGAVATVSSDEALSSVSASTATKASTTSMAPSYRKPLQPMQRHAQNGCFPYGMNLGTDLTQRTRPIGSLPDGLRRSAKQRLQAARRPALQPSFLARAISEMFADAASQHPNAPPVPAAS